MDPALGAGRVKEPCLRQSPGSYTVELEVIKKLEQQIGQKQKGKVETLRELLVLRSQLGLERGAGPQG